MAMAAVKAIESAGAVNDDMPTHTQPKLLDRMRYALRSRHCRRRTEETHCHWVKRFIYFHHVRHPSDMAEPQINAFLTGLAVKEKISASSQNIGGKGMMKLWEIMNASI